jgi:hypothetical protein
LPHKTVELCKHEICRTNRNFSFCRQALIKVRSARTVFLKEGIMGMDI